MGRISILSLLFVLVAGAGFASYGVRLGFFKVEEVAREFSIEWQMDVEDQVREYDLKRRTPFTNSEFISVKKLPPQGANRLYQYRDTQVYKSAAEQVDYRLEVVYTNGLREVLVTKSLNYTPTAIRRTWGSIKAMFQ